MSNFAEPIMFGTGRMLARQNLSSGVASPLEFGALQDVSVEFKTDIKKLYGRFSYAIATADGKAEIMVKAKSGSIKADLFNRVYFGATSTATQKKYADGEAGLIPSSSTYTVTVANASTFVEDWGVTNAVTGLQMTQVASGPAAGQYSVAAGVYTFAAANAGVAVVITYSYSTTAGFKIPITQTSMGAARPVFSLLLANSFDGRQSTFKLNVCRAGKFNLPFKDDFAVTELEIEASADATGQIGEWSADA
jgi:hypothetical protein